MIREFFLFIVFVLAALIQWLKSIRITEAGEQRVSSPHVSKGHITGKSAY